MPQVIEECDNISDEERLSLSSLYNFFCGMHLVVNMAECSSESLRLFEWTSPSHEDLKKKRGNKKFRLLSQVFRLSQHTSSLSHFRGNCFSILFHNAAAVYFLRLYTVQFLIQVPNKLLAAVLSNIQDFNLAACKALGLVDKYITGPPWRILESDITFCTCQANTTLSLRCTFSTVLMQEFMTGETIPFNPDQERPT